MTVTVDRFENGRAVCVGRRGHELRLDLSALPKDVREGSILRAVGGRWIACPARERRKRKSIQKKLAALLRRK